MSFDLSRIRFDHRRDFLGVVMQQGRVQLDADWNEWVAELARRIQAGTFDTFSGSVVPRTTPEGFLIESSGGALSIGRGRIYVDGLLAENHGGAPNAWDARLAELAGTTRVDYTQQPYYPNPEALPDGGPHLVYVDVWQRDVTALQDPGLVEQAVGVDTTGRLQTVWQVKVLPRVGDITCATPDAEVPGWNAATAPSGARLTIDTGDPTFESSPCQVPPAAGYRGLENQSYRVEVHRGGAVGTATFKWSRDNGTVASRVTHVNPARDRVTVERIGRDDILRFNDGDWVEVTDDWRTLHGLPGELRRIRVAGGVDETARTLRFDVSLSAGLFPTNAQQATDPVRNTIVRRWDQAGQVRREDGTALQDLDAAGSTGEIEIRPAGTRLFLEHGILVDFSLAAAGTVFSTGDYWVFAARSVDASLEILDHAPPLGIHHHYARLAVVTFPDSETDCRVLWPPVSEGEGCDCTVCVSAEGHNSGQATIQQAIDATKDVGGTICLGIGTYDVGTPLTIEGGRSLRMRGQGWATVLAGVEPGELVRIVGSSGVALENLTIVGAGSNQGTTAMISARNVIDLRVEHVNVLGLSVGDGTSVAVGVAGYVLGLSIDNCVLVADRGLATTVLADTNYVLTGETVVSRSVLFCSRRLVSFHGTSLHFGNTRIHGNLMLGGTDAAVLATGAVLRGSTLAVADNVIYTAGDGVRAGVDGLAIERNEIAGQGERGRHGIVLEEGLDPVALDRVRIVGNRLLELPGNAIAITHRLESALIADNVIDGTGLGAVVMSDSASAGLLTLRGNQCQNLGRAVTGEQFAFAAVQLVRVGRGDVVDNVVANVGRAAIASPAVDGLRSVGHGQLRVAGNRFFGIGPDRSGGRLTAVHLVAPFDNVAVDDNHIDRVGAVGSNVAPAEWYAINVAPEAGNRPGYLAPAHYLAVADAVFLLTATRVLAAALPRPDVSIRGNTTRAQQSVVPLTECLAVDNCVFTENRSESTGDGARSPFSARLQARTLNASHNRLIGLGDEATLELRGLQRRAIVIGNTSTGSIELVGCVPVPADITLTNILGV